MGVICAVAECKNTSKQKVERKDEHNPNQPLNLIHHRFPVKDKLTCLKWVNACRRQDKFNPSTAYICSDHFASDAYQRDLEHELLGLPTRRRLKLGAVPTIFSGRATKTPDLSRLARMEDRKRKSVLCEILDNSCGMEAAIIDEKEDNVEPPSKKPELEQQLQDLQLKLKRKNRLIAELKGTITRLRLRLREQRIKKNLQPPQQKAAATIFSGSQMKKLGKQKRVNWTVEDIVKALSVRSSNIGAYETARVAWKLPLPSQRTLRRWIQKFSCLPGILHDVIEIMKSEAKNFDVRDRICALSFDEMSINSKLVIDKSARMIVSSSKVQVVLARGICSGWKQPIYYDFDAAMTKSTLFSIIKSMESAGYPVHSICSDLGGDNRGVLNSLGVDVDSSKFENPVDKNRWIHVFCDVPHMIELLRNHILDDGVLLENGVSISKDTFQKLVDFDDTTVKLCPKLSIKLLSLTGPERMRVRPALQLLSHHVSCLALQAFPDNPAISEFISTINNGFDVLNSRVPVDEKNKLRSGFCIHEDEQILALAKLRQLMVTSRFFVKSGNLRRVLLPFQKGLIMSVDSVMELSRDLKRCYNLNFVLTSRLNQDALESLFSRMRAFGGPNTNPTPPEFKYRLRLLLLGSKIRAPRGTNTDELFENCNWISAKLLQRNNLRPATPIENIQHHEVNTFEKNIEAVRYLAGYIAFKLKKKGFNYGVPTAEIKGDSWIHTLSRGGLLLPNDSFFAWIDSLNDCFERNCNLLKEKNSYNMMVKIMQEQNPEIGEQIIKQFLSTRLNIQVNRMNVMSGRAAANSRHKLRQIANSKKRNVTL